MAGYRELKKKNAASIAATKSAKMGYRELKKTAASIAATKSAITSSATSTAMSAGYKAPKLFVDPRYMPVSVAASKKVDSVPSQAPQPKLDVKLAQGKGKDKDKGRPPMTPQSPRPPQMPAAPKGPAHGHRQRMASDPMAKFGSRQPPSPMPFPEPKKSSKKCLVIFLVVALIVLVFVAVFVVFGMQYLKPKDQTTTAPTVTK